MHVSLNREKLLIHFFHPAILNSIFYMHAKSRDHSTRGSSCVHMLGVSNTLRYDGIIYIQDLSKLSKPARCHHPYDEVRYERREGPWQFEVGNFHFSYTYSRCSRNLTSQSDSTSNFDLFKKRKIKNALFVTILQRLFQKLPQKSNFLKHLSFQ